MRYASICCELCSVDVAFTSLLDLSIVTSLTDGKGDYGWKGQGQRIIAHSGWITADSSYELLNNEVMHDGVIGLMQFLHHLIFLIGAKRTAVGLGVGV
jgi:hypothetical protein